MLSFSALPAGGAAGRLQISELGREMRVKPAECRAAAIHYPVDPQAGLWDSAHVIMGKRRFRSALMAYAN